MDMLTSKLLPCIATHHHSLQKNMKENEEKQNLAQQTSPSLVADGYSSNG